MAIKISPTTAKKDFILKIEKLSGQNIQQCFQCGTCSGSCPMLESMDMHPRKIMRMVQLGLAENLESINTCWICASCHTCNVMCPRGVDLPRVMEALRLISLRKNRDYIDPSKLPEEVIKDCPQIAMVAGFRKLTS